MYNLYHSNTNNTELKHRNANVLSLSAFRNLQKVSQKQKEVSVATSSGISKDIKVTNLSQAHYVLSLVEDPLWRHVCKEILIMMGPGSVLEIWKSRLGPLTANPQKVDLYCATAEMVEFLETYNFIVLAALQRYFPSLQRLHIISQAA